MGNPPSSLQWRHNGGDGVSNHHCLLTIVYSTVYLGAYQRKHQSSTSLAIVGEIHRSTVVRFSGRYICNLQKTVLSQAECPISVIYSHFLYTHNAVIPQHDDVSRWKHFPRYWHFVRGPLVTSRYPPLTKASDAELWCCFFICTWTNGSASNRDAGDLRRNRAHYGVTVMKIINYRIVFIWNDIGIICQTYMLMFPNNLW